MEDEVEAEDGGRLAAASGGQMPIFPGVDVVLIMQQF